MRLMKRIDTQGPMILESFLLQAALGVSALLLLVAPAIGVRGHGRKMFLFALILLFILTLPFTYLAVAAPIFEDWRPIHLIFAAPGLITGGSIYLWRQRLKGRNDSL